MSAVSKTLYMPLQLATSIAGGLLASKVFQEVWQRVNPADQEPPNPKDLDRPARQAIIGAALQGVVFATVRALVDRAGAHGYRAVTKESPK